MLSQDTRADREIEKLSRRLGALLLVYDVARKDVFVAFPGTKAFFSAVQRGAIARAELENMAAPWIGYATESALLRTLRDLHAQPAERHDRATRVDGSRGFRAGPDASDQSI